MDRNSITTGGTDTNSIKTGGTDRNSIINGGIDNNSIFTGGIDLNSMTASIFNPDGISNADYRVNFYLMLTCKW
jgi:hypothetical protein